MLESLDIHAFALIEDIHIDFTKGFTVITGETGAGKSIMLSALSLLLGGNGSVDSIRVGFDKATVCGCFYLDNPPKELISLLKNLDIDFTENTIIIRRILKSNGRTLSYVNDSPINKASLLELSSFLVDISAQHSHQSLLRNDKQLILLDNFASLENELNNYQTVYNDLNALRKEREEIALKMSSSKREEDYLRYALDEISKVDPKPGEDEMLDEEVFKASKFEDIHDSINEATSILNSSYDGSSTLNNLNNCVEALNKGVKSDKDLSSFQERLKSLTIECEDIYESLKDYLSNMSFSEEELDNMQTRLSQLQRLKKKYGPTLDQVITFKNEIEDKINALINGSDDLEFLDSKIKKIELKLKEVADVLSEKRIKGAKALSKSIEKTLHNLGMPHAVFEIEVVSGEYKITGAESICFKLCANPGLPVRAINEIASGGELSRVMLAIKATLREKDPVGTLIFDEVDAGIGGVVASSVADELINLSTSSQVVAITHLASIACKANVQLVVKKFVKKDMSYTSIIEVKEEERVKEIARMLSGDSETKESLDHARALLA